MWRWIRLDCGNLLCISTEFCHLHRPMKIRRVYEELLKQEKRAVLRLKCLSGATAFILFAVFLMVLLGLDVFQKLAKCFAFESGNCVIEESIFTGGNVSCDCGMRTCFSRYPCLRILVRISEEPGKNVQTEPVLLYNTYYDLGSEVSRSQSSFLRYCVFEAPKPYKVWTVILRINGKCEARFHEFI